MRYKSAIILVAFILAASFPYAAGGNDKEKEQLKQSLDDLKNEITLLERQVKDMQQGMDRNSGQFTTLITQISDNVLAVKQAQSRVAEAAMNAITEVSGIGERLNATNQRIGDLSGQIAELRKMVENMPKLPAFTQITPGNPDQLFAAGIADYFRGNYDLARSEFQQYIETYRSSQIAGNAQYWIGECYFAKGKYTDAIKAYDTVVVEFGKSDKTPAARYKKGKALQQLGRTDEAMKEFLSLIKLYKTSNEAALAQQELNH